jgi:hypothetical protein
MRWILLFLISFLANNIVLAQQQVSGNVDSLKREIMRLDANIDNIQLNLNQTQKRFKLGILTATIGYSIVIAGGQMLGRKNDDIGQALLYVGGGIGLGGTILLIDSYRYMRRASEPQLPDQSP